MGPTERREEDRQTSRRSNPCPCPCLPVAQGCPHRPCPCPSRAERQAVAERPHGQMANETERTETEWPAHPGWSSPGRPTAAAAAAAPQLAGCAAQVLQVSARRQTDSRPMAGPAPWPRPTIAGCHQTLVPVAARAVPWPLPTRGSQRPARARSVAEAVDERGQQPKRARYPQEVHPSPHGRRSARSRAVTGLKQQAAQEAAQASPCSPMEQRRRGRGAEPWPDASCESQDPQPDPPARPSAQPMAEARRRRSADPRRLGRARSRLKPAWPRSTHGASRQCDTSVAGPETSSPD